jgi:hypothetical protein
MHWRHVRMGVLALMMTGCPSEFGKDGRVNKAVRKDSLELVKEYCSTEVYKRYCEGGRERTQQCRDKCGG